MARPIRGNFLTLLKLLKLQTIVNDRPDAPVFPVLSNSRPFHLSNLKKIAPAVMIASDAEF